MDYPRCPNPAHDESKVWRAGWYGTKPHRRQRWWCKPRNGDPPHRFTELLPRQETKNSHCPECSMALDSWAGQAGARGYAYHAREVAGALALVASGRTYSQAAAATRLDALRTSSGVTWSGKRPHRRMRRRVTDGQLVANWVDVFGPVIVEGRARTQWPTRLVVDSVEFNASGLPPRSFHVMVAVGYEPPFREPATWLMRPFPTKSQASWETFFSLLAGTPQRVVADMDHSIRGAVLSSFPRGGARPPTFHWSDFHVNRALANALAPLKGQPEHPVMVRFANALHSEYNWDAFVKSVEVEDQTGTPLPAALRWVRGRSGLLVRGQTINRTTGPYSTGPVEAVNVKLKGFLCDRTNRIGNRPRAIKLLDLLTVGLNGRADERAFAADIRAHLEAHQGHALLHQRLHDDPKFNSADPTTMPSLFV